MKNIRMYKTYVAKPGDVDRTFADVSLARQELGYQPSTDLRTGLARFVEWFQNDMNRQ